MKPVGFYIMVGCICLYLLYGLLSAIFLSGISLDSYFFVRWVTAVSELSIKEKGRADEYAEKIMSQPVKVENTVTLSIKGEVLRYLEDRKL